MFVTIKFNDNLSCTPVYILFVICYAVSFVYFNIAPNILRYVPGPYNNVVLTFTADFFIAP